MGAVFKSSHLGFLLSGEASDYLHDQKDFGNENGLDFLCTGFKRFFSTNAQKESLSDELKLPTVLSLKIVKKEVTISSSWLENKQLSRGQNRSLRVD